ncbi:unnamed protein product, partial [Phaeothamnion confervicola]
LPAGRLKSKPAGDDDRMVRARRALFDTGAYRPVHDAVAGAVAAHSPQVVLDSGCGEGTYLASIIERTGAAGIGIDISKVAVRLAARRHRDHRYAVASAHVLPLDDAVVDAVVSVFSPRDFVEMGRVLDNDGVIVVASPGAGHLRQLKELIYDSPRDHREPPEDDHGAWRTIAEEVVRFTLPLPQEVQRLQLLQMTPYWWSTDEARRHRVWESATEVDVDVLVRTYAR